MKTSFWYDEWSHVGQMIDLTGTRGFIDMGIHARASVGLVLSSHRRRRHKVELLNKIENIIEEHR